jgi:ATP adenylyltransferase
LLNKFNALDHHLVIATRSFEPQEMLLTREDCAALLICLTEVDGLGSPFSQAYTPMDPAWIAPMRDGASSLLASYHSSLAAPSGRFVHKGDTGSIASVAPYNLLMTRQLLLLVPRSEECFKGTSINALGFAGVLLRRNKAQLAMLRTRGPMTTFQRVALPHNL